MMIEPAPEVQQIPVLLDAATTYANGLANVFTQFLTVVFGALAFASALSLRTIGPTFRLSKLHFSGASLLIGGVLFAYFSISFLTFLNFDELLALTLAELHAEIESTWTLKKSETLEAFQHPFPAFFGMRLPGVGFAIGSVITLIAFLWISNVKRESDPAEQPQ